MSNTVNVTPGQRLAALKREISSKGFVRIIEAHSGLSAIVGESARVTVDGVIREYDGIWESRLTTPLLESVQGQDIRPPWRFTIFRGSYRDSSRVDIALKVFKSEVFL